MSTQQRDDDVIARLQAGAPGYPDAGPDAERTLSAARRALRRRRVRQAVGGVAAIAAMVVGLTAIDPVRLPGLDRSLIPGGSDSLPDQGNPPVYPHERMLQDVANLDADVRPVAEDLELTTYIDESSGWGRPACRVFTWSQGAFRDRHSDCANPDDPELPFNAESEAAFNQVSAAVARSGVEVYRIDQGGWGPGTSYHLRDNSWQWNWYYSYIPGTPADAPREQRTQTALGVRLQVHVSGNWWFTVEPDD